MLLPCLVHVRLLTSTALTFCPSLAGGAGASEPGQRGDQPGGAAAGCECCSFSSHSWAVSKGVFIIFPPLSVQWQRKRHVWQTRGAGTHMHASLCPCPYPFARRPGPPTGGSCRSQQGSSTRRAPTWGAASRRPGPTMKLGGWLRRYDPHSEVGAACRAWPCTLLSLYGVRDRSPFFSSSVPLGSCLSFLCLLLHSFTHFLLFKFFFAQLHK